MKTKQILATLKIISWVVFIGLCIKAGAMLISFCVSLFVNGEAAKDLYLGLDLSVVYDFGLWHFVAIGLLIISLVVLKSYMFYLVIRIFSKVNLNRPFSLGTAHLITRISYISLIAGIVALGASGYSEWLFERQVEVGFAWGSAEFLFMAGIVLVVGLLFKRGIEMQTENELTT